MKEFTQKSLAEFNGTDGKPVYIAYQGKVFDVSGSKLWKGGLHMKRHHAGCDLSLEFQAAPHKEDVLERYPQVGIVKEIKERQRPMPAFLSTLIQRYPMLERHPHPMTVHFPIVFLLSVVFFDFLYLVTGNSAFEVTALHCLVAGILFLPVAAITGLFTWWLNYLSKPVKPVMIKIILSSLVFILSVIVLLWRMADPGILDTTGIGRILYCLIIIAFVPMISAIGALGASLTFPVAKK